MNKLMSAMVHSSIGCTLRVQQHPVLPMRQRSNTTRWTIYCVYEESREDPAKLKWKHSPQNVDLPRVLPKRKKKPFPIPLKEMKRVGKNDTRLAQKGIIKHLDPPKNGLLVPNLVPVAHEVLDSWKMLIKGVAQLMHVVPVHACCDCSRIHIGQAGHKIQDCLGPGSSSRHSLHSWVKASVDDVLIPVESYHQFDPFGRRIKHDSRFDYDRIPAIMELCIQAGVDLVEYPSCRRTEPIKMIGKKILNRGGSVEEQKHHKLSKNSSILVDLDTHDSSKHMAPLEPDVPLIAQNTMDAYEKITTGLTELMKKYSVKACGYCSEVHVGPWGHSVKLCGEHKHQWRDGKHGWQDATIDEIFPPNYVWHVREPESPQLRNMLKRFYGKAPAVVELCMQAGAKLPDRYIPMMRLDIIIPDSGEADMVA